MDANRSIRALVFALATLSLPAAAQSAGDIGRIQAETILYRAQAARNEALAKARGEQAVDTANEGLPVVRGVYGTEKSLYATFLYANGSTVDARVGDSLPGSFTVARVTPIGVTLRKGGKSHVLGFSDLRPFPAAMPAAAPAAVPAMPPPGGPAVTQ